MLRYDVLRLRVRWCGRCSSACESHLLSSTTGLYHGMLPSMQHCPGRYGDQKARLRKTGISRKIYLVEGQIQRTGHLTVEVRPSGCHDECAKHECARRDWLVQLPMMGKRQRDC